MTRGLNTKRQSNIELLRIVAMMFILFGHTHLRLNHMTQGEAVVQMPISSFFNTMMACISTTGVGIFIAISGWFGIRFKTSGLLKYIYIVLLTLWAIYGIAIWSGTTEFNFEGIKISMGFYHGYWFIMGYLGLYLISPILNTFIDHASRKEYQIVLLSYFLFQAYCSWLSGWYDYYDGYSIIMFGGIYLTAAYIRKYPIEVLKRHTGVIFTATALLATCIALLSQWKLGHAARQIRDDNPLVILMCIMFVLGFSKIKFHSRIINWLAASCFAVYLIHFSPFVYPYLMQLVQYVYAQYDGVTYTVILLLLLCGIYIGCTLIDQIRIVCWSLAKKLLF